MVAKPLVITAKTFFHGPALVEYQIKYRTSAKSISYDIDIDPEQLFECAKEIASVEQLSVALEGLWQFAVNVQSPVSLHFPYLSVDKKVIEKHLHSIIAFNYYHLYRLSNIFVRKEEWDYLANIIQQQISPPSKTHERNVYVEQANVVSYESRIRKFIEIALSDEISGMIRSESEWQAIRDCTNKQLPFYFSVAALSVLIRRFGYVMSSTTPDLSYSNPNPRGEPRLNGDVQWLGTNTELQSGFQFFIGNKDEFEFTVHHLDTLSDLALLNSCLEKLHNIALTTVGNSTNFLNGRIYMSIPKARKTGMVRWMSLDSDLPPNTSQEVSFISYASENCYNEQKKFFSSKRDEISWKAYEQLVSDYPDIANKKLIDEIRETEIGVLPLALEREAATLLNLKLKLLIENTASVLDVASFKSVAVESVFDDRQAHLKQKNLTPADLKTVQYLGTIPFRNLVLTCFNELVKEDFLSQTAVSKNDLVVYFSKANATQIIVEVPLRNQLAFEHTHSQLVIFWL